MLLKEFISAKVFQHVQDLDRLSQADVDNENVKEKFRNLRQYIDVLNERYPESFSFNITQQLKACTSVGTHAVSVNSINPNDTKFIVGHSYLAERGRYKVIKLDPYPTISPKNVCEKCETPFFMKWMWEQHVMLLKTFFERQCELNEFAFDYVAPNITAQDVGAQIGQEYNAYIIETHKKFLQAKGLPYGGARQNTKSHRVAHCYNCKRHLDNAFNTECINCTWIICSCGACGCGFF